MDLSAHRPRPLLRSPAAAVACGLGLGACRLLAGAAAADAAVPPPAPARPGAEAGATRISVDVWFADISAIDSPAQTFSANLVLVLRWRDAGLAHRDAQTRTYVVGDIRHPRWMIANEGADVRRSLPETLDVAPDGTVAYRQRVTPLAEHLNLHRFPFDADDFRVHVACRPPAGGGRVRAGGRRRGGGAAVRGGAAGTCASRTGGSRR